MSDGAARLDAAWAWYQESMARLTAIEAWIKNSRPDFYAAVARPATVDEGTRGDAEDAAGVQTGDPVDLNKLLRPLLAPYAGLSRKQAIERLKQEHDDVRRIALVRLFSGFEADFQRAFARWMKGAFDRVDPGGAPQRREEGILQVLPSSIELCLLLAQQLQPRFSGSDKGWLDRVRGLRNKVLHAGFSGDVEHDVEEVHARLGRILALFGPLPDESEER